MKMRLCNCALCQQDRKDLGDIVLTFFGIIVFVVLCWVLAGCASYDLSDDKGAGIVIVGEDAQGFYFNDAGHALWLKETVPADYFTTVVPPKVFPPTASWPGGVGSYYITDLMWEQGKRIKLERHNHMQLILDAAQTNVAPSVPAKAKVAK